MTKISLSSKLVFVLIYVFIQTYIYYRSLKNERLNENNNFKSLNSPNNMYPYKCISPLIKLLYFAKCICCIIILVCFNY